MKCILYEYVEMSSLAVASSISSHGVHPTVHHGLKCDSSSPIAAVPWIFSQHADLPLLIYSP